LAGGFYFLYAANAAAHYGIFVKRFLHFLLEIVCENFSLSSFVNVLECHFFRGNKVPNLMIKLMILVPILQHKEAVLAGGFLSDHCAGEADRTPSAEPGGGSSSRIGIGAAGTVGGACPKVSVETADQGERKSASQLALSEG
jgi:hypothetical protein